MKDTAKELRMIVHDFASKISEVPDYEFGVKPHAGKWSKKEVLGHLIDSSQNNLRRFIVGQYESQPSKIVYDQDFWVMSNHYQTMKKDDIIILWKLMNERIATVLENMPPDRYSRESLTSELHTLEWLAADYLKHLKHHLNQIISGSFDVVYK